MRDSRFGNLTAEMTLVVCLMLSSRFSVAQEAIIDFEPDRRFFLRLFPWMLSSSGARRLPTAEDLGLYAHRSDHSRKRVDY